MIYLLTTDEKLLSVDNKIYQAQRSREGEEKITILDFSNESVIEDVLKDINASKFIELDTETDYDYNVFLAQIGIGEHEFVIDTDTVDFSKYFKDIVENDTQVKLLQNAKFDYKVMLKNYGIRIGKTKDTMLAEMVLTCGLPDVRYSLDELHNKYLGIVLDKSIRGDILKNGITYDVVVYSAKDVRNLNNISKIQENDIITNNLQATLDLENDAYKGFAEMEFNGMFVDVSRWKEVEKKNNVMINDIKDDLIVDILSFKQLKPYLVKEFKHTYDMFTGETLGINFNSSAQVKTMFHLLGKVLNNRKLKQLTTTSDKEVERLAYIHPIIQKYREFKKKKTETSKYGSKWIEQNVRTNKSVSRVFTNFWLILNTGRVSSSKPNMQQLPKETDHRTCFYAPFGWSLCIYDFSSQELALIAEDSGESTWIDANINGWDLHSNVATKVFGKEWDKAALPDCMFVLEKQQCKCPKHKEMRKSVKTVNYALTYGAGESKIANLLQISLGEARVLIYDYFMAAPKLKAHFKSLGDYGTQYLKMRSFLPFRRTRFFERPTNSKEQAEIVRQSMNTRFQATGADMTKLAVVLIYKYIKEHNLWHKVKFMIQIHDEIIMYVKDEYVEEWSPIQKKLMEEAASTIVKIVKIGVDGSISKTWKAIKN